MTADVSGPGGRPEFGRPERGRADSGRADVGRPERGRTDVVSAWSLQHRRDSSVAIGAFGFSRRQWIVAIVLIVVAVIDVTRGYALVMSSVNTMQHSGESSNLRTVIGQQPATTSADTTTAPTKSVSAKK
jgi:hypothetical protein